MKFWEINNNFLVQGLPPLPSDTHTAGESDAEDEDAQIEEAIDETTSDSEDEAEMRKSPVEKDPASMSAFEKALHMFDFKGSFVQSERYAMSQAANPCLEIEGLGPIGLPLSERIANFLLSTCSLDSGSRAGVLEIPAEKIRFQNPDWDAWLQKHAGLVCTELAGQPVQPFYQLRNLVIESTGSESTSFGPTAGAIGTLVVFVPSLYSGGQLECSHGVQSKTIDFAPESQLLTSVFAAYSAVKIAQRAITAGYRLSLIYDILENPDAGPLSVPALPDPESAPLALQQAMSEWKEDETGSEPEFVAYFLQRRYPMKKTFNLQELGGSDAVLVAHLIRLAEELRFQLYVVQLELYQSKYGTYDPDGRGDRVDPRRISNLETEGELTGLNVKAIDAQGVPVQISRFDFKGVDYEYLNGEIEDVPPYQREYDRFNDEGIRVDERHGRTLFIIWPTPDDLDHPLTIRYSPKYVCWALGASVSTAPSVRENILVDSIRADRKENNIKDEELEAATRVLCKCANQWSDLLMLLTALETNSVAANLGLIGIDNCVAAYRTFGWIALKSFFREAVAKDISNPRRQSLVTQLGQAAKETADTEVETWCQEQQGLILRSLNRSGVSEVDWLLELVTEHSVDFVREIVYPQLHEQHLEPNFWVHFVRRLGEHPTLLELDPDFSTHCVRHAVDNLPAFPTYEGQDEYCRPKQWPATGLILDVLTLCVETGNIGLCVRIFDKMEQAACGRKFSAERPPWKYYLELARSLDTYLQPMENSAAVSFQPFFTQAVVCILSGSPMHDQPPFSPCPFTVENLSTLVSAIKRLGSLSFLDESTKNVILAGRDSESLKTLVVYLVEELQPPPGDLATYTALLHTVVRQAIDVFDTKRFHAPESKGKTLPSIEDMVGMLKFCFEVGAQSQSQYLLLRFASPPPEISIPQHVSKVLAPFISALRDYLVSQNLDLEADSFNRFTASVVKAFAASVMTQTPQDSHPVAGIGCQDAKCGDCKTLRAFFEGDEQTISLPRAARFREHIEKQLGGPKSWGVRVTLDKDHGSPHRLEKITKPDNMTIAGLWAQSSERGKALLAILGDEPVQRRILGQAYEEVLAQICEGRVSAGVKRAADNQIDTASKKARISPP
ncbi:hypothetical protein DFH09DRAFT_1366359 [Mycena vulgaris]|nr:hypothetical protein DFH09DRAFT_1366359 [Mycena vulgaris]